MKLSRRNFLQWASLSAMGAVACDIFREGEMNIQSPVDLPEDLVTGQDNWYSTLCPQCPEREGMIVRVMEGRAKKVQGNPLYPTNRGKQSVRCEGGLQALYHPDRLSKPLLRIGSRQSANFREIGWDEASSRLVARLSGLRDAGNANAMLMVTEPVRGHLGLVVDRFVGGYGGRRIAFEAMDQTVLRSALKGVYGQDTLPDFDIENSGYLISFGADFLSTWVSPVRYSRGYGEFRGHENGKKRGTHIHVGSRYSMTAANADEWVPITPGKEGILALSIAYVIISEGLAPQDVIRAMTGGAGAAALDQFRPDRVVSRIGMPESIRGEQATDIIVRIAREFAEGGGGLGLAIGGGETGAHTNGLFNLSAVYALNYLVGSVGRRPGQGGVVFNPPPPIDGLPAPSPAGSLADWSRVADELNDGQIEVLMVQGPNPVHALPTSVGFQESLGASGAFVVSFSSFMDDTTQMADLILPQRDPLEEWGDDVPQPGPGYEIVGMQQPVVNPLSDLDPRSFPDLLLTMSQELGLDDGLPNTFKDLLRQGAQRLFELNRGSVEGATFEAFWNKMLQQGGWWDVDRVSTASPPSPPNLAELARGDIEPSFQAPTGDNLFYFIPFLSNSLLDGRGSHLPWLQAAPDPLSSVTWQTWIEINSQQAKEMGWKEGDVVRVVSTEANMSALVYPHPAVPRGLVGIPVGQGHAPGVEYQSRDGSRRGSNPMSILAPETDRETGALAWAATRVLVVPTGDNQRVSKFEGIVPAFPFGTKEEDIVQVTKG